ncbi:MAG: nucleic acid-binding protein [Thermoplasmatales archaeon SG8-52-3]|nr:MAG: nucleic acid-binding protein [Thermoplasmatales archaeon SG8-52-3]
MKRKYIIDTSAIFSGKPIDLGESEIITTLKVSDEITAGGRDYQNFQYLKEKGLIILTPTKNVIKEVEKISNKTGDKNRLSDTDIELIALALELKRKGDSEIIILTDDYSIQNVANTLNLKFESINQAGITKRFKWGYRCRGCGKKFKDSIKICPICGAEIRSIVSNKKIINNCSDKK